MPHKDPEKRREYIRDWKRQDRLEQGIEPRRVFASDEERRETRREYQREYMREYREKNPEIVERDRARARVAMKDYRERKLYGLEPGQYEAMLEEQEHRCAICGALNDVLCVDHDHDTGDVRGLLCKPCNLILGMAGDSVERLMRAADYLTQNREEA